MNRNLLIGLGIFLAVIAVGFFLLKKPQVATTGMPVPGSDVTEKTVTEEATPAREITVTGNEYSFNPSTITAKQGERIKLTFVNAGAMLHNFVIDELRVQTKMVGSGKSDIVEFTVEGSSPLIFYCGVSNHRSLGMEGKIIIEQ